MARTNGSDGVSGMALYNGGGYLDGDRSEGTDVQTIMLQQETNEVLNHLKHRNLVNDNLRPSTLTKNSRISSSKKAGTVKDGYSSAFSLNNNPPSMKSRMMGGPISRTFKNDSMVF